MTAPVRDWLIYNGRNGQFWGPDRGGYWGLWGAGLYTEAEALDICRNKDRDDRMQHISEYRDQIANMRGAFDRLNDALVRSDEARGIRCRDFTPPEFTGRWRDWHRGHGCHLDDGKPRSQAGVAEIEVLGRVGS